MIAHKAEKMINNIHSNKNVGFTLLEVLISLIILAVGLLGIAGLQVTGLMNNNSAAQRSQATVLAGDFADILRTNKLQVDADLFGTEADDGAEISTATKASWTITDACTTTVGCTTAEMAQTDVREWIEQVALLLPQGIVSSDRDGDIYTVTITWVDNKKNIADQTKSFQTSFMP